MPLRGYRVSKPCLSVGRLMPAKGKAVFLHKVWVTDRRFGLVYLALAHVQTRNGFEEWALLSDAPTDLRTFDEYGLRFDLKKTIWTTNPPVFNWNRAKSEMLTPLLVSV